MMPMEDLEEPCHTPVVELAVPKLQPAALWKSTHSWPFLDFAAQRRGCYFQDSHVAQVLEEKLENYEVLLRAQLTHCYDSMGLLQLYAAMDWQYLFERMLYRGCENPHLDSRLRSPLHYACAAGLLNIVHTLVQDTDQTQDPSLDAAEFGGLDISGRSPLHLAVRSGQPQVVKMIAGLPAADLSVRDTLGQTALHEAAHSGLPSILEMLLQNTRDEVNARALDGTTAVHLAVIRGHRGCLNILLAHPDTDVNAVDGEGCTALHRVTSNADKAIVEVLLCHNDIDIFMPNEGVTRTTTGGATPST